MQQILDELQSDIDNELEKVSLERLADINPHLVANIKKTAEGNLREANQSTGGEGGGVVMGEDSQISMKPSFLTELRSDETVQLAKAWAKLNLKHVEHSNDIIQKLQTCVKECSSPGARYFQSEAVEMTRVLAAASAAANLLSSALERRESEDKKANLSPFLGAKGGVANARSSYATVDKSLFTNSGIKTKNSALIGMLYEVGLPFVSSSDGRRFKTQLELSKHLDRLFKRRYVVKLWLELCSLARAQIIV
jgi:pre-mRNA cleavage complex 2 protein Pcf11